MGLNKVDDYFRNDTELQNYTKTGVKRYILRNHDQLNLIFFINACYNQFQNICKETTLL